MRFIAPILLFLDEDPDRSSKCLTNFHLEHGIRNSVQVLMCSVFYVVGFRNKAIYRHYVCKDRWEETRFRYFPNYPMKSMPKFSYYNSPEARWCRKCQNHFNLLVKYLGSMLEEHAFRYGNEHQLTDMYSFFRTFPIELAVRRGIVLPHLKDKTKIQLPWKNLPVKYRKKDIVAGYRAYYKSLIPSPLSAFIGTKRDVPEFLIDGDSII